MRQARITAEMFHPLAGRSTMVSFDWSSHALGNVQHQPIVRIYGGRERILDFEQPRQHRHVPVGLDIGAVRRRNLAGRFGPAGMIIQCAETSYSADLQSGIGGIRHERIGDDPGDRSSCSRSRISNRSEIARSSDRECVR